MLSRKTTCAVAVAALLVASPSWAQGTLRIALPTTEVPATTGMPTNAFQGMSYLGYPVFESLIFWDLTKADEFPTLKPSLATAWESDPQDRRRWTFKLRKDVKFHDGSAFDADAVIWNLERFYDEKSPQFDVNGSAIVRGRVPMVESWQKIDPDTVAIVTKAPISYFPEVVPYILFSSPAAFAKAGSWAAFARAPSGTGPFRIDKVNARVSAEMVRNDQYWDPKRKAHLDRVVVLAMAEANTRVSALRSGQVDVIVEPPPDALPSLRQAGFKTRIKKAPSIWPYIMMTAGGAPFSGQKVRQAANYAIDREAMVKLLGGTVEAATGFWPAGSYGATPQNSYRYDPAKARQLLQEAGVSVPVKIKIMIATAGGGQLLSQPMNEILQQNMKASGFDVEFQLVDYNQMLVAFRQPVGSPTIKGLDGINLALITGGIAPLFRWFSSDGAPPAGSNWGAWKDPEFDALLKDINQSYDKAVPQGTLKRVTEILVDNPPWVYVVQAGELSAYSAKVTLPPTANWYIGDLTTFSIGK